MPRAATQGQEGDPGQDRRHCAPSFVPQFPRVVGLFVTPAGAWLCSGRREERRCGSGAFWFPSSLAMTRGGGTRGVARSAESRAEARPLLRHELTHPGISTPPPPLTLSGRCHSLSPRCPHGARRALAHGVQLLQLGPLPSLFCSWESGGGTPWRDPRGSPTHIRRCRGPESVTVSG